MLLLECSSGLEHDNHMEDVTALHVAGLNGGLVAQWGAVVDETLHLRGDTDDLLDLCLDGGDCVIGLHVDLVGVTVDVDLDEHVV